MVESDRNLRDADSVLPSGSRQNYNDQTTPFDVSLSQSINTLPSLHPDYIISSDLLAGQITNGKMSHVRRSFCLLVTFDLLFISFLWLICVMSNGENIMKALKEQVYYYNVHTSLFDIVMCAVCRFVVLLLFYALLYINHWTVIALSTALTCAFLIGKVFVYDWSTSNHPTFEVPLVLLSFVLSWAEAWFLDSRVIPQELNARRFIITNVDPERAPLIRSYMAGCASVYTESATNYYSPVASPEGSVLGFQIGETGSRYPQATLTIKKEEEYRIRAITALQKAWDIATTSNWQYRTNRGQDKIYTLALPNIGKTYKLMTVIDIPPDRLLEELFHKVESIPEWNPAVVTSQKVQALDDRTDITYQVSATGGAGMISSRDFVTLRHWDKVDNSYVLAWESTEHPDLPLDDKCVRGKNVIGCFIMEPEPVESNKCSLQWVLNIDLDLKMPEYILETAMKNMMFDYMNNLRNRITSSRSCM